MEQQSFSAKAPGSLMLFGEHAVLHGSWAIACSINKYITATLLPRVDKKIILHSDKLNSYATTLTQLTSAFENDKHSKWCFVLQAIAIQKNKLPSGFDLSIDSDFDSDLGLGSSAAVTVATLKAINTWLNNTTSHKQLIKTGTAIIRAVQGSGSGTDIAASVLAGVVLYKMKNNLAEIIAENIPLTVIYSGSKKPTKEVIEIVEKHRQQDPELFAHLFSAINLCTLTAKNAIIHKEWQRVGSLMNVHQDLQNALGVSNEIIEGIITALRASPEIYGAKISGSGLGDCVIGLGKLHHHFAPSAKQRKIGVKQILER